MTQKSAPATAHTRTHTHAPKQRAHGGEATQRGAHVAHVPEPLQYVLPCQDRGFRVRSGVRSLPYKVRNSMTARTRRRPQTGCQWLAGRACQSARHRGHCAGRQKHHRIHVAGGRAQRLPQNARGGLQRGQENEMNRSESNNLPPLNSFQEESDLMISPFELISTDFISFSLPPTGRWKETRAGHAPSGPTHLHGLGGQLIRKLRRREKRGRRRVWGGGGGSE